jgi:hypothetical protein
MAEDTETIVVDVAKKLAEVIKAAKPKANVFHYWILGQGPIGESWTDVISPLEDEWAPQYPTWAHAYVIGDEEDTRIKISNARVRDGITFRLWGFYGFLKGTSDRNSNDVWRVHYKQVQNAITKATRLQTQTSPQGVTLIDKHDEWQINQNGVYWMGQNKCHIVQGTITVHPSFALNPTPIAV